MQFSYKAVYKISEVQSYSVQKIYSPDENIQYGCKTSLEFLSQESDPKVRQITKKLPPQMLEFMTINLKKNVQLKVVVFLPGGNI